MGELQKKLVVDATMENLDMVIGFVEEQLEQEACPMKLCRQILVSFEEVYVNVANYAYVGDVGTCEVITEIVTKEDGKELILTVRDQGHPFNPLEREDPDVTLSVEERQIGGLGIYMVKQFMDQVTYTYESGVNILTIFKKWKV